MKQKTPDLCRGFDEREMVFSSSDPGATRTHDQWLKRPLLYQLSYRIKHQLIDTILSTNLLKLIAQKKTLKIKDL